MTKSSFIHGIPPLSRLTFNVEEDRITSHPVEAFTRDGIYEIADRRLDLRYVRVREGVETPLTEGRAIRAVLDAAGRDPTTGKRRNAKPHCNRRDHRTLSGLIRACEKTLPFSINETGVFVRFKPGEPSLKRIDVIRGSYRGRHKGYAVWGWDFHVTVDRKRYLPAIVALGSMIVDDLVVLDAVPETDGFGSLLEDGVWTVAGIKACRGGGEITVRYVIPDEGDPRLWACSPKERGARQKAKVRREKLDRQRAEEHARRERMRETERPEEANADDRAIGGLRL